MTDSAPPSASQLAELLYLEKQYASCIQSLTAAGLMPSAAPDVPTPDTIQAMLDTPEKRTFVAQKIEQGFTKLLMVPFGQPLAFFTDAYKELLLKKQKEGNFKSTDGIPLTLDLENPLFIAEEFTHTLVYFPQKLDENDHGGKPKEELPKWQVLLVQDLPDLPVHGETKAGRTQIEPDHTPVEYLNLILSNQEQGFTPEAWFTLAATELEQHSWQIDDWQGKGKATVLAGAMTPSGGVPTAFFFRAVGQAFLAYRKTEGHRGDRSARASIIL